VAKISKDRLIPPAESSGGSSSKLPGDARRHPQISQTRHIYKAYRDQFPFLVGGSDEDPFEHRQVDLARERLGKFGLRIERLPGGHLTTNERPEALAALITKFDQGTLVDQDRPLAAGRLHFYNEAFRPIMFAMDESGRSTP
jgi:hypothetical protein